MSTDYYCTVLLYLYRTWYSNGINSKSLLPRPLSTPFLKQHKKE